MTEFVELDDFYKNALQQTQEPIRNEVGHFNIFKVEDLRLAVNKPASYSRRDFFKISLVTGRSKIHYADQSFEVTESVLVFTNPMVPYFWEILDEDQKGYVCIFTESFFSKFGHIGDYPVFQQASTAVIPLSFNETDKYKALFERMLNELQSDYLYKYDLLRNLLMEIVHEAQKLRPLAGQKHADSNASERIAGLFTELLERQFPIEYSNQCIKLASPSAYATKLNVHVNHLNKALKETTGQTTSQLINARIAQEAKILLRSTNWTIAEIAWTLGFEEPNHFSSFFKKWTKTTPKKFRIDKID